METDGVVMSVYDIYEKYLSRLNPCDYNSPKWLQSIGGAVAHLCDGTDCRCCLGFRMVFALMIGIGFGLFIGWLM